MKKQLLLLLTLCATLSTVAQQSSHPKLPIVRVTQKDGKYGLSDNSGKCLVDNVLDHIKTYYSREYMITVKYNKEYFIVDRKGCIVANAGRALPMTFDQFVVINRDSAIDANGKELFPGKSVSPISLLSGENRFYLFANKPKGDQNSRYQLVTINNEVVSGKLNGYYTPIFSGAIIFSNFQESQCGVLNSLGDVLVPCKYSSVESFNFNELRYECKLDKTKLPKLYDSHLFSTLGLFVAQRDSYYTIYDQSGTQLTQPKMYKNATEAIKKNFKKSILPHFMRRGYVMQSIQEKINNPNRIRYEEYIAAAKRLPLYSSSGKSLNAHIAHLEQHPNVTDYTIAEVVALKNKTTAKPQQSASRSSSSSSRSSQYTPAHNTMPNGTKKVYYMNRAGHIASISTKYYEKGSLTPKAYWSGQVFVYKGGGSGTGYIRYYSRSYSQNGAWVFIECDMYGRVMSNGRKLYVAHDWSYIKEGNEVFNIPISKEKFDSLQPKGYINNGGGYNNSSSGSSNSNDSGRSYVDGPCKYCGGGGGCSSCNGRGYKYNPYSGYNDTCPSCNGSGRCFNCRGTGKQATY